MAGETTQMRSLLLPGARAQPVLLLGTAHSPIEELKCGLMSGFVTRVSRAALAVSLERIALGNALFKSSSLHTAVVCSNSRG